jgi:hypothetical protein
MIPPRYLLCIASLLILSLFSLAHGRELDLYIKEFKCTKEKYILKFGVINKFTYNRQPTVAFKIRKMDKILACKKIPITVPEGSDGSKVHEVTFDIECGEELLSFSAKLFERSVLNRLNFWLSDCPL